jgi:hypothetical protein
MNNIFIRNTIYVFILLMFFKNSDAQEVLVRDNPWGFYSIQWTFESVINNVQRIDVPITINEDVPDDYQLFVQVAQGTTTEDRDFYAGIQTNIMDKGNGAVFSRWAKNDAKKNKEVLSAADVSDYEFYEIDDYEGSFCSVRRRFPFEKGSYTMSFVKNGTWISYEVNGTLIGKINFKEEQWNLTGALTAFLEIYGGGNNKNSNIESDEIPYINITFGRPVITTAKNIRVKPYEANVTDYGKNESNGKFANITTSTKKTDGINAIVDWKKVKYSSKEVQERFEFKTE